MKPCNDCKEVKRACSHNGRVPNNKRPCSECQGRHRRCGHTDAWVDSVARDAALKINDICNELLKEQADESENTYETRGCMADWDEPEPTDAMALLKAEIESLKAQIGKSVKPTTNEVTDLIKEVRQLKAILDEQQRPENTLWLAASALGRYKQQQAPPASLDIEQTDNLPVGLACLPDPQIGGSGTAYNLMVSDAEIISNTEGLWPLCPGDVAENFITPGKLAAASRGNVIQPDLQWDMARDWIRRMRPKRKDDKRRLIIVPGNHDDFSVSMASVEPLREIAEDLQAAYLRGSVARITFMFPSGVRYDIAFAHKFRMHSTLNLTHRPKQMIRFEAQWADIAIVGDRHEAAWEYCRMSNTDRVVVACDTYKCVDPFSASLNYSPARAIIPVIILSGDKKKMVVMPDLESGASYLNFLRLGK